MRAFITYILICLLSSSIYSQLPASNNLKVGYRDEAYGHFNLHTSGWGLGFNYGKFKTYKKKRLYHVSFNKLKHNKEYKIPGFLDEAAKDYVFGKLNGFGTLRLAVGVKKMHYEKLRDKGVKISSKFIFGPSIGLLKPVYLDVLKLNAANTRNIVSEKYNPEEHNLGNIYGQTRGIKGLSEITFIPGVLLEAGLEFEFNHDNSVMKALEVGLAADLFPQRIEILTHVDNPFIFPTVYLHFILGKRFN